MASNSQRTIILFGAHRWRHERYVDDARAAGLRVVLAQTSRDRERISRSLKARVQGVFRMPPEDRPERLSHLVGRLDEEYGPGWRVLAFDDYVGEEAVALALAGKRRYMSKAAEEETRCKHLMRRRWNRFCERNAGMRLHPTPYSFKCFKDFGQLHRLEESEESPDFAGCAGPFIVKPDELAASAEVRRAESRATLDRTISEVVLTVREKWRAAGDKYGVRIRPRVQVEAEIPRSAALPSHPHAEFSAEVLSAAGRHHLLGVTQKWVSGNFLEVGHVFPAASLPPSLLPEMQSAVERLLREMGVWYGVSHWEFIVTPEERLALVESQMRPGGDRIMELVEYATGEHGTGIHPVRGLLDWLAGKKFEPSRFRPRRSAAICFLFPSRPVGRVREVTTDPALGSHCREWFINREGLEDEENWRGPTEWGDRHVWVIATGKDIYEARERCRDAARCISLIGEKGRTRLTVR